MIIEVNTEEEQSKVLTIVKDEEFESGGYGYLAIDDEKKEWMKLKLQDHEFSIVEKSDLINDSEEILLEKLSSLFYEVVEIEQSGTDSFSEESNEVQLNPYDPEKIKVRTERLPISILPDMITNGDVDLNPDFQRHLVWNNHQKSLLIESILLRIPLPMFYFAEDKDGRLSVVDGLQRLSTINEFMNNGFPLKNLQYLEGSCGGRYYRTEENKVGLDPKYFRWFNLTNITANIIDPTSPYKVKYDIFRRINTGGKPLNNQEIRNCLTGQGLREALKTMASTKTFKGATNNSLKSTRMADEEIALRFLVFYEMMKLDGNINSYNGYMDETLDKYTDDNSKTSKSKFEPYYHVFSNAMKNAEYLFGAKYAFRKVRLDNIKQDAPQLPLNKALLLCASLLLTEYLPEKIEENNEYQSLLIPLADLITADATLFYYLSYGTNGKANLLYVFEKLQELFQKNIKY